MECSVLTVLPVTQAAEGAAEAAADIRRSLLMAGLSPVEQRSSAAASSPTITVSFPRLPL